VSVIAVVMKITSFVSLVIIAFALVLRLLLVLLVGPVIIPAAVAVATGARRAAESTHRIELITVLPVLLVLAGVLAVVVSIDIVLLLIAFFIIAALQAGHGDVRFVKREV
jgi:hypothetical protein